MAQAKYVNQEADSSSIVIAAYTLDQEADTSSLIVAAYTLQILQGQQNFPSLYRYSIQ